MSDLCSIVHFFNNSILIAVRRFTEDRLYFWPSHEESRTSVLPVFTYMG